MAYIQYTKPLLFHKNSVYIIHFYYFIIHYSARDTVRQLSASGTTLSLTVCHSDTYNCGNADSAAQTVHIFILTFIISTFQFNKKKKDWGGKQ